MVKVTFTLDDETVRTLRNMAERTRKPQSLVVREAIADYAVRGEHLSDEERDRALKVYDTLAPTISRRTRQEVSRELREVRQARRRGGRRSPAK
jgi:predicted transcriptional regulator